MKIIRLTAITFACLLGLISLASAQPELDRLKANYVQDLWKLYDRYSDAGSLDGAAKVIAELKAVGVDVTDHIPPGSIRQFIANTAWKTPTGTIFEFQANGKGMRSFNGKDATTLIWNIRPRGLIEVRGAAGQGQAETMWLFRFENRTEGYYGSRENDVVHKLKKVR